MTCILMARFCVIMKKNNQCVAADSSAYCVFTVSMVIQIAECSAGSSNSDTAFVCFNYHFTHYVVIISTCTLLFRVDTICEV